MTRQWIGYCDKSSQQVLREALLSFSPSGRLEFATSAAELRVRLRDEEPKRVCAIIGFCGGGISDVNLAAAVVHDGFAEEVVLVARGVTGSFRSRAACAGISHIVDMEGLTSSARVATAQRMGERGRLGAVEIRAEGKEQGSRLAASTTPRAPIVAFASGRGGVGKTLLAALAAAGAGRWGLRVALCDLDLSNGNLYESAGLRQPCDIAGVVSEGKLDGDRLMSAGLACMENVTLWGPCERPEMAETVAPAIAELLGTLAHMSELVIVDTSTTCTDAVAQAMQLADRLVIVHGPEHLGLSSAARTSALAVRLGVARTRIVRVENGCVARDVGQPFIPRAEVGLETARAFRVVDGGDEVDSMVRAGKILELSASDGAFAQTALAFTAQLLEELGSLPENDEAHQLSKGPRRRGGRLLLGRRREVA